MPPTINPNPKRSDSAMGINTRAPIFSPRQRNHHRAAWSLEAATEALARTLRLATEDGGDVDGLERALLLAHGARRALSREPKS